MAKFADQLFTDLMAEYRPTLEQIELPQPHRKRSTRPVWLSGGAAAVAALIATVLLVFTTGAPAYAVTRNPDGTVTLTLNQMTALTDAAAALHSFGAPSAVGCQGVSAESGFPPASGNSVVINPKSIPPGRTGVLMAAPNSSGAPLVTWVVLSTHAQDCAAVVKALKDVHAAQLGHAPTIISNANLVPVPTPASGGR